MNYTVKLNKPFYFSLQYVINQHFSTEDYQA